MTVRYSEKHVLGRGLRLRPRDSGAGFRCSHCRQLVPVAWLLSGVRNRNHCPYCLYSRHLDLLRAGDRLAACKGSMQPVALTCKHSRKRYGQVTGERMLVHRCCECGKLSFNRIAADDDGEAILSLLSNVSIDELEAAGIQPLTLDDFPDVREWLFGKN
jgi:DNA-directed RNA polymerase subunit RPC12/RpoP